MINGLKPLDRTLRWGMVGGGGAAARSAIFTALQRCAITPSRCWPAR